MLEGSETESEKTTVFAGICENHWQDIFFEVKPFDALFKRIVLIHDLRTAGDITIDKNCEENIGA